MRERTKDRVDIAVAVVVVAAAEIELLALGIHPLAVAAPLAAIAGGSLAVRRRFPLTVVTVCVGAVVADTWAGVPQDKPVVPLAWLLLSMYSVALSATLKRSVIGFGIGLGLFASTLVKDSSDLLFGLVLLTAPWLVGLAMRSQVNETSELAGRAAALERTREADVAAAAADERARIARDLHDIIAHSVTVMVVQAGAASETLHRDPTTAGTALRSIQDVGRAALTEIAALLGMLREHGDEIGMAPQPGLADLDRLLEQTRQAGLPVELRTHGTPRRLPMGIELSVYRIVQEALTNTRKHAGPASAVVTLSYAETGLCVEICDDGRVSTSGQGGRHGLVGMRERVAVYGGSLDAGPVPGGGYLVRCHLPDVRSP